MIKIAINGLGRIGRAALKIGLKKKDLKFVAINDLTDAKTLAYLLKYDSVYGQWDKKISYDDKNLIIDGVKIPVIAERDPAKLPWKKLGIDVVLECTGIFLTREQVQMHLDAGAKKVIISAPAKGGEVPTYVLGVNDSEYQKNHSLINNASCTTNCIAPIVSLVEKKFGILKYAMTTIHSYTSTQKLQDGPHKDLRRGRAAAFNIIPTTTGAAEAIGQLIPDLDGLFDGFAIRVPVINGSLADFTFLLKKNTTVEEVNNVLIKASKSGQYKNIISVSDEPLVSSDIIGNHHSSIVDLSFTKVIDGNMVKILSWYDNEWGYSNRLVELALLIGKK